MAEYIERAKAIECIRPHVKPTTVYGEGYMQAIEHATNILELIPTADVQPVKHGKWESSQRTIETGTVYCSNCAIEYYISDLQTVGDCNGIVHYCPNCGARMKEG